MPFLVFKAFMEFKPSVLSIIDIYFKGLKNEEVKSEHLVLLERFTKRERDIDLGKERNERCKMKNCTKGGRSERGTSLHPWKEGQLHH